MSGGHRITDYLTDVNAWHWRHGEIMMQEDAHAIVKRGDAQGQVVVEVILRRKPDRTDHTITFDESANRDDAPILPDAKTRAIEYAKMKYSSWSTELINDDG